LGAKVRNEFETEALDVFARHAYASLARARFELRNPIHFIKLARLTSKKSDCYVPGAQGGHCAATIVLIVTDAIVPIVVMIV
jgi:hypothetical protein